MDENKLDKLREMEYFIPSTCNTCMSGKFVSNIVDFGVCLLNTYEHKRQTANDPHVSIYRYGQCPDYIQQVPVDIPKAWIEFMG